jgi:hypothetical protein
MKRQIFCVICQHKTANNLCHKCENRTRTHLNEIITYTKHAAKELAPSQTGEGRTTERSLGINLDALDLIAGNTVLPILESWEAMYRAEWQYPPLGPVTLARAQGQPDQTIAYLTGTVTFLKHNLDKIATHETVKDFTTEIGSCWYQARNAARRQPRQAWRVTCPTDTNRGECGNTLRITGQDFDNEITCRTCQTTWPTERLLRVVASSQDAEIWVDSQAAARQTGVPESTLRRWAKQGKIKRRGTMYEYKNLNDVVRTITS